MKMLKLLMLCSVTLAACTTTEPAEDGLSKEDARASTGKGDHVDFCEVFGWYGDGVCDDFCQNADPDCGSESPTCTSDAQCDAGEKCNADDVCLSPCAPGEVCIQVCTGFCVEDAPVFPTRCGGFSNLSCSNTEWCDLEDPPVGAQSDLSGICLPRPEVCTADFTPVCGRDGNTYSNACVANSKGIDVKHAGSCP